LELPDVDPRLLLENVIAHADFSSPENISNAYHEALNRAEHFFIKDGYNNYRSRNVWFRSRVQRSGIRNFKLLKEEPFYDCLVFHSPNPAKEGTVVGLILPADVAVHTHFVVKPDGSRANARVMVKVKETNSLIDPFAFRYDNRSRCHQALNENGTWQRMTFDSHVYQISDTEIITEEELNSPPIPVHMLEGQNIMKSIEFPSMVFVILPDDKAEHYGVAKMLSHFQFGVQSQCIIATKYLGQRNDRSKDQYCSNVAIKVNAKLSSTTNKAHAWGTYHGNVEGIPWVTDCPTFVMGISLSNTMGQNAVSIISASACLDGSCMRFAQDVRIQSKTEILDESTLVSLTKGLLIQYFLQNQKKPERILVYRDGISDGSFSRVQALEIQCFRTAFMEFKKEIFGDNGGDGGNANGSVLNCPPITFVVCMTRNNIKMVPARDDGKKNVWSGTVLDNVIMDMPNLKIKETEKVEKPESNDHYIYSEPDGKGYDFILVAHGGRMGTSKTVHYRTILNENAVWRPNNPNAKPLTKQDLELLTFHMSFQYSTASKAVRIVPVVHYSSRLANMAMSYINYLRGTKGSFGQKISMTGLAEPDPTELKYHQNRDGSLRARFQYIRGDFEQRQDIPSHLKTSLLPRFAALNFVDINGDDESQVEGNNASYQMPFFSHIAA